jgi:hypothetical protein
VCAADARSRERAARHANVAGRDANTRFGGLNGHPGCSTRSAVCLHWRLLGTACLVGNFGSCSATLGTWVTPKASILTVIIGGFFIFPLTQMLLRLSGRHASVSRENSFNSLGMQVAFVLPFSMLLLVPVGLYQLNWFFPALMVLVGAHYLPFATLYGMRMFLFLAGILIAMGVVIAHYFSGTFSLGAWCGGLALFAFAWIGRSIATAEASAPSTH